MSLKYELHSVEWLTSVAREREPYTLHPTPSLLSGKGATYNVVRTSVPKMAQAMARIWP